jgi:diaminohydroxyphosphoribosylaminopyrimidine deaminase/5-amino-6-(5-phosphoribosylamino)uracil reductase
MMKCALELAGRARGAVEPNPMVGCVLVRDRSIIGRGYHRKFGGDHAEVAALRNCTGFPGARFATMYVTLEPCRHFGKTPPCVEAIIRANVKRVVVAARDPLPQLSGGGAEVLRAAGIPVDIGLLEDEALELMAPFFTRVVLKRPYVIAKWAQSLDGRLAAASGDSKWISCEASRQEVHEMRAMVDAIIVGSQTVLTDDPLLTVRDVRPRRTPCRVVLDGRLRIAEECRLVATAGEARVVVFTSLAAAATPKAQRLAARGVEVVGLPPDEAGRISPAAVLNRLYEGGATNVVVEGGAAVLSSFFAAGLVDEARVFVAPIFLGSGPSPVVHPPAARMADAPAPLAARTRSIGRDALHTIRFTAVPRP